MFGLPTTSLGGPRYHLSQEGGAAARGHVHEGHLAVSGVAALRGEPVERPVGQDDELLGRQELDDEHERGHLKA